MKRIVVFASGHGSNLLSLHQACVDGRIDGNIIGVISDNVAAPALDIAHEFHIPSVVIDHTDSDVYHKTISSFMPELIILAGYMRILPAEVVNIAPCPIINIHPSKEARMPTTRRGRLVS